MIKSGINQSLIFIIKLRIRTKSLRKKLKRIFCVRKAGRKNIFL